MTKRYCIAWEQIDALLAAIAEKQQLIAPKKDETGKLPSFSHYEDGFVLDVDALNTAKNAKEFFFQPTEDIARFSAEGKKLTIETVEGDDTSTVYFGVRACDARSFDILDRVFLADPIDPWYEARRLAGTVVTLACDYPEETCFCSTFDIDLAEPGSDVSCHRVGDLLYWSPLTEKGRILTASIADMLEETKVEQDAELVAAQKLSRERMENVGIPALDLARFAKEDATEQFFDVPEWSELSEACLGCGSCTYLCPTCQCYDVRDFIIGENIQRYRCWDSCMVSDFTRMAHGNMRTTQLQRFRQRFMHKLVYYPANNDGIYSCVGCGRCLRGCPISMNIVKVARRIGVKEHV